MPVRKHQFSEAELKVSFVPSKNAATITSREQAQDFLYAIWDTALLNVQEQFYVVYRNQANQVLCWRCLHTGTIAGTTVDLRLLFGFGFGCKATGIIIAHNHPTGYLKPSQSDVSLTHKIKEACKLLDITLVDSFILASGGGISMLESGLL